MFPVNNWILDISWSYLEHPSSVGDMWPVKLQIQISINKSTIEFGMTNKGARLIKCVVICKDYLSQMIYSGGCERLREDKYGAANSTK